MLMSELTKMRINLNSIMKPEIYYNTLLWFVDMIWVENQDS